MAHPPTSKPSCEPVDILASAPIAICMGCLRVFDPQGIEDDITCPHCKSEACDCYSCVAGIGELMMGDWASAGLLRPWSYVFWTAEGGIVVDETRKGPRDG